MTTRVDSRALLPPAPWAALAGIIAMVAIGDPTLRAPVLAIVCIALSFFRLDLAVLLWMVCAGLAPLPLMRVRNSAIVLSTAVLSMLLLRCTFDRLRGSDLRLPRSRLTTPLLAVSVTAVASGLFGALFYDSAVPGVHRYAAVQLYATALVVLSVAAAFIVNEQIQTRCMLIAALWILIGVGSIVTLVVLPGRNLIDLPRWYPIIIMHAFVLLGAAVLCGLFTRPWQWLTALVLLALALEGPASSFLFRNTQWISGWIMLGLPLLLLPVLRFPRAALAAIVIGAAVSGYWIWPRVEHAFAIARYEGDFNRLRIWQDALMMGGLRPFLGVGLGNYIDYAERYADVNIALASAHGNYQQIIAEMGMTGLGFVLWLLVRAVAIAWRLFRTASDRLYQAVGLAALGGLAGQMGASVVGDYLLPAYHNGGHSNISATIYTWMLLGVLMSTERLAFRDQNR